eukprot:scaffold142793_cov30-Tisochrysis_lutea.AAC.2
MLKVRQLVGARLGAWRSTAPSGRGGGPGGAARRWHPASDERRLARVLLVRFLLCELRAPQPQLL